jgi:hypothetical protein
MILKELVAITRVETVSTRPKPSDAVVTAHSKRVQTALMLVAAPTDRKRVSKRVRDLGSVQLSYSSMSSKMLRACAGG